MNKKNRMRATEIERPAFVPSQGRDHLSLESRTPQLTAHEGILMRYG